MARVATYQRNVNVVLTDILTGPTNNIELQNGIKIKEEPIDTTANTTEDCTSVINNDDLISQNKPLKSHNSDEVVNNKQNNKENKHLSDSDFTHLNNIKKTRNLKRKHAKDVEKQIHNTSSQSAKRRKCSNEVSDTTKACARLTKNFKKLKGKRERANSEINSKDKIHQIKVSQSNKTKVTKVKKRALLQCDVCFRNFNNRYCLDGHIKYYEGVYICRICDSYYENPNKLIIHNKNYHLNKVNTPCRKSKLFCNFCNRTFKIKDPLQSHLFHTHRELINGDNCKAPTSKSLVNTSCQNTLKIEAHEESRSTDLVESKNKYFENDSTKTTKSNSEESLATDTLNSKKLRQPTLMEYLELCKRNHDTKNNRSDLDNTKNCSSTSATTNKKRDSSSTKLTDLKKQVKDSTLKQNTSEMGDFKQPLVTLHTDVKTMISCLEKDLNKEIAKRRSPQSTSTGSNLTIGKTRNTSKKWEAIKARFKCKNCKVLLKRCDKKPNNLCQIPTIKTTTEDVSLNAQRNSSLFQETDIRTEVMLKRLEISIERINPAPAQDIKAKTAPDVKNYDNKCYICSVCNEGFSLKEDRRAHIKSCHVAYMSSICNARYTSKHSLLQHYLSEHPCEETQCCVCSKSLSDDDALKEHLNIHCLKYIYSKDNKYAVDVEIKCSLTKESYKCCHCNNIFSSQSTLMVHESQCTTQIEMENEKSNAQELNKKTAKVICLKEYNINTDGTTLYDKKIISDDLSGMNNNSGQMTTNLCRMPESEREGIFEEDNQPFFGNLLSSIESLERRSGTIAQNAEQSLEDSSLSKDVSNAELEPTETNTGTYPCNICGKQFQNSKNLRQHIRSFSNPTDVCPLCDTAFSSKRLLQSHIVAAHVPQISKTYTFHCMFCNQGFIKKYELRPHVLHLHGQQMFRTFMRDSHNNPNHLDGLCTGICDVCNIKFETRHRYAEHRMYYYTNHKFTCSICKQDFQGMYMFHHHYKLAHYSEDKRKSYKYICDICEEGFNHESHFHSHKMHVHEETSTAMSKTSETGTLVDRASETWKVRNATKQQKEMDLMHLINNEYVCPVCQLKCTNVYDIVNHIILYSTSGEFKCDKCDRQCKTREVLEQHKTLTHSCDIYNGYLCHVCGEVLETVGSLQCHEKHFHSDSTEDQSNADRFLSADIQKHFYMNYADIQKYRYLGYDMSAKRLALPSAQSARDSDIIREGSVQQLVQDFNQTPENDFSNPFPEQSNNNNVVIEMATKNNSTIEKFEYYKHQLNVLGNNIKDTPKKPISAILPTKSGVKISTSTIPTTKPNNRSQVATSVPSSIESSDGPQTSSGTSLNSSKNDSLADSVPLTNNNPTNKLITVPVTSKSGVIKLVLSKHKKIAPKPRIEPPVNPVTYVNYNYVCPLCSLLYPSLMYFHAHLMYAHAHDIRNNTCRVRPSHTSGGQLISVESVKMISAIECLLCPAGFNDEASYKTHLKNVHTRHVVIFNETVNANTPSNPLVATKNRSPEIITIDDDDDNLTSVKDFADETTAMANIIYESPNIGKLRVKPFAKINEKPSSTLEKFLTNS